MFQHITQWLLESIRSHGIAAVLVGVAIETIIVPIPSPLILMAAGFILIQTTSFISALITATGIAILASLAQTLGSYFLYGLAYFGGKPLLQKSEKWHGVSWKEIEMFQKKFGKGRREEIMLFILRALPIIPLSIVSGVAGIIKIRLRRYTLFTLLGTIPRNLFLAMLGWELQELYYKYAQKIDSLETIMSIFLLLMIFAYLLLHKYKILWKIRKKILS
ncbi:VTT domain-containing protein [Candidatus Woesearchaeota archaeon]|nr:VTT domain-containing protein [Candidatus Woesearchaeota archaeon]